VKRKSKEARNMIPAGLVPEWLLGKPLDEWLISQLPEDEARPMLEKIRKYKEKRNKEKRNIENG